MTILSSNSRMSYTGNGATSTYSFTFKIFNQDDLLVTVRHPTTGAETTLVITTDYTVTLNANGTGSITLVNASQAWLTAGNLTTSWKLVIRRVVDLVQETDIRNQGTFFPEDHENAFDYQVMLAQQLKDAVDRSLKVNETDDPLTLTLPTASERASQFLGFDVNGEPIAAGALSEVPVSSYMQTVLDDTTAAAARTTLGFVGGLATSGSVNTASIDNLAVTTGKIANNAVTLAKASATFVNEATTVTAASGDLALIADASDSNNTKKVPLSEIFFPTATNALSGSIVQSVRSQTGAYSTSSTALPIDNTIPQNTEGAEITALNTTITPTKIGNKLRVTAVINWGAAAAVSYAFALFKDSNANAVYATVAALTGASYTDTITLIHEETVASLSATTFKIRAGATAGNTIHINGSSSTGALFNGTCISSMTVEEVKV